MILAHYSLDDFYIFSSVALSNQCPYSFPHILDQYLIAILRDPYQMDLQIVNGMCRALLRSHSPKILKPLD